MKVVHIYANSVAKRWSHNLGLTHNFFASIMWNESVMLKVVEVMSEFTQQDGRKKRTAKRSSVTNVTGLLLACFVANSLNIDVSCSSTKRSVQRNVKFGGSKAKAKLLSRLSHKVYRRLSSPVLLRKFTNNGT